MPASIPLAITKGILGPVSNSLLIGFSIITHFALPILDMEPQAVLFIERCLRMMYDLGWGLFLWLIIDLIVLPLLGWGVFGTAIMPAIAVSTLVLHLIYGGTLGWGRPSYE